MSQGPDPSLAHHLARINRYRQDSGLVAGGVDRTDVRRDLAAFMAERTPAVLDAWMRDIGPTFGIPEADWPGIMADQAAAIGRWARHIADPADCDTYVMLRRHRPLPSGCTQTCVSCSKRLSALERAGVRKTRMPLSEVT